MSRKKPVMSHDPLAAVAGDADSERKAAPTTAAASRRKRAPARNKTAAKKAVDAQIDASDQAAEATDSPQPGAGNTVVLPSSITIMDVGELRAPLLANLERTGDLVLDGSEVEAIEGAGVQMLAAFFKSAGEKGIALSWLGASDSLRRAVTQVGLNEYLDLDSEKQVA